MPFVPREYQDTAIFLYPSAEDARKRTKWGGSGFLLSIQSQAVPEAAHLYAVTNDHVAKGAPVVRLTDAGGFPQIHDMAVTDWVPHPDGDDIAICPLGVVRRSRYFCAEPDELISPSDLAGYGVGPGDDCLMIGRYVNHAGEQFDRAALRFGNLAMLPEPVLQEGRQFDQLSFLVDMRSVSGFSGSPVLVYYEQPGTRDPLDPTLPIDAALAMGIEWSTVMSKVWVLGLNWGNLPYWDELRDLNGNVIGKYRLNSTMACVVPAWKLTELLEVAKVKTPRDNAEERLEQKLKDGAVMDIAVESEFDRFEALAREMVNTPKPQIDKES